VIDLKNEENLFFRLSKYQKEIEKIINDPSFIEPIERKNEIINFVSRGLKDFSISRTNVTWGIPVPGYNNHTFYVWFDALLGYVSAISSDATEHSLEKSINGGWPADVHFIGKDILRFHAVYWPAMLISANMKVPKKVFGHGFLTREGQKMGRSLGNVLDPDLLLTKYGNDPVRWYLIKDISLGNDGDFQDKRFVDIIKTLASSWASKLSGMWTAIWSPSKSALKAAHTKGWSSIAIPSINFASKAWTPNLWRVGALFKRIGCSLIICSNESQTSLFSFSTNLFACLIVVAKPSLSYLA